MPHPEFMLADRQVSNFESPVFVRHGGIRMVDHKHVRTHPHVNSGRHHGGSSLGNRHRFQYDPHSIIGLHNDILLRISYWQCDDIVRLIVAVKQPNLLIGPNNHRVWNIPTVVSVQHNFIISFFLSVGVTILFEIGMNRVGPTWEINDDIGNPFRR